MAIIAGMRITVNYTLFLLLYDISNPQKRINGWSDPTFDGKTLKNERFLSEGTQIHAGPDHKFLGNYVR